MAVFDANESLKTLLANERPDTNAHTFESADAYKKAKENEGENHLGGNPRHSGRAALRTGDIVRPMVESFAAIRWYKNSYSFPAEITRGEEKFIVRLYSTLFDRGEVDYKSALTIDVEDDVEIVTATNEEEVKAIDNMLYADRPKADAKGTFVEGLRAHLDAVSAKDNLPAIDFLREHSFEVTDLYLGYTRQLSFTKEITDAADAAYNKAKGASNTDAAKAKGAKARTEFYKNAFATAPIKQRKFFTLDLVE